MHRTTASPAGAAAHFEDGTRVLTPDGPGELLAYDEIGWPIVRLDGETVLHHWHPSQVVAAPPCTHDLVEVLSANGRNLEGAVRQCAACGLELAKAAA